MQLPEASNSVTIGGTAIDTHVPVYTADDHGLQTIIDLAMLGTEGVYIGLPNEVYHASIPYSRSDLHLLASKSAAHLHHKREANERPGRSVGDALAVGSFAHTLLFEPEQEDEYHVLPEGMAFRSNADKAARDKALEAHGYDRVQRHEDVETCRAAVAAVKAHHVTGPWVERDGLAEVSVIRTLKLGVDVTFKARADWLTFEQGLVPITDLKTTKDASRSEFEKSAWRFGYALQAVMYRHLFGLCLDASMGPFRFACVEKEPPFAVAGYTYTDSSLSRLGDHLDELMWQLSDCIETERWPGYTDLAVSGIDVPRWAL